VVCYVSGFDLRRIEPETTPFLDGALSAYPWTEFTNLPSNELFPTLVTGVDPAKHEVWGVKLKPSWDGRSASRLVDHVPDALSTSVQGFIHLLSNAFDLAAVPPRRRRRFEITRTKYKRRRGRAEALYGIGGVPTVFDVVGHDRSRYVFYSGYEPARRLLPRLGRGDRTVEIVELYSLDRIQQWNLDRSEEVRAFYRRMDEFLEQLHRRCARSGTRLMLVSDHGHEPIRRSIDIHEKLAGLSLPEDSYSCFVEVSSARFWFHQDLARTAITEVLAELESARLVHFHDMAKYGVPLADDRYGECFCFLDPGLIFFPHDFHQPLANLWLGLADRMQRSRLRDPRHRGNHGHLPHFEVERSFVALLDAAFEAKGGPAHVTDVAPTILDVVGREPPSSMGGRALFARRSPA